MERGGGRGAEQLVLGGKPHATPSPLSSGAGCLGVILPFSWVWELNMRMYGLSGAHLGDTVNSKGPGQRWVCPGVVWNLWVLNFV